MLPGNIEAIQYDDYPIIFIHGHSGNQDVEDTWLPMANQVNGLYGYSYYGKIWEKSKLPKPLPKKSIFIFGFYRDSEVEIFSGSKGKIGGIPLTKGSVPSVVGTELTIGFVGWPPASGWYKTRDVDYKDDYFDSNRVSYAERLSAAVDAVLNATHSDRVILVTHSMGGLVARSYIRWLGGEKRVFKLLTVAAPNHGIADDNRAAMEMIWNAHASDQAGGEYLEMSARSSFGGKSYTTWLNDDWVKFCTEKGVRYATVAGNKNPYPIISIGKNSDGVIDRDSVFLEGAEFNGLTPACHIKNFGLPFVAVLPDDQSVADSTYTKEIIKRWIFQDEVHIGAVGDNSLTLFQSPFGRSLLFQYAAAPDPVVVHVNILDLLGNSLIDYWTPGFSAPQNSGMHHILFDTQNWPVGGYIGNIEMYDMNGRMFSKQTKLARSSAPDLGPGPKLTFAQSPMLDTFSSSADFLVASNIATAWTAYKLDGGKYTDYSAANSNLHLKDLAVGLPVIYFTGTSGRRDEMPIIYRWMVNPPTTNVVRGRTFSIDEVVTGSELVRTDGAVVVNPGVKVRFLSKREVRLLPGFIAKKGSYFQAGVTQNFR